MGELCGLSMENLVCDTDTTYSYYKLHAFWLSTAELHPPHVAELQRCIIPSFAVFINVCFLTDHDNPTFNDM